MLNMNANLLSNLQAEISVTIITVWLEYGEFSISSFIQLSLYIKTMLLLMLLGYGNCVSSPKSD